MVTKFLLLHAKSDGDEEIDNFVSIAHNALAAKSKGKPFEVVTGRDQFTSRFRTCGSWEAWAQECATGVDSITRVPIFAGFLVPWSAERASTGCLFVGAGTSKTVQFALNAGKPVFVFRGDGKTAKVTRCRTCDVKNWQSGYALDHADWK